MRLHLVAVVVVLGIGVVGCSAGAPDPDTVTVTITNDTSANVRLDDCLDSSCSSLADSDIYDTIKPGASIEHNVATDASVVTWVRVTDEATKHESCLDLSSASASEPVSSARAC